MGLAGEVPFEAFEAAAQHYYAVEERQKEVLTLIDFTAPSSQERLWVIDMEAGQVLYHTHVAHGRGSGELYAEKFSNVSGSHQSSLGTYLTQGTYQGRNGYSLVIDGLEKGLNDRAKERAVVVHGAPYADPGVIASTGRLGRSLGCPALPPGVSREIIDTIKGGSVLYIYGRNDKV